MTIATELNKKKCFSLLYLALLSTLLLYLLTACGATSTAVTVNQAATQTKGGSTVANSQTQTNSQLDEWLHGVPCQPPCWEGITPDHSTFDQVEKLVASSSWAANITKLKYKDGSGEIGWDRPNKPSNEKKFATWGGTVSFDSNSIATGIFVRPRAYKLSEIVAAYGFPEYVIANTHRTSPETSGYNNSLHVIYLSKGFSLWIDQIAVIPAPFPLDKINGDVILTEVDFFPPGTYDNSVSGDDLMVSHLDKVMVPWQGYNTFAFYCRNEYVSGGIMEIKC